MTRLNRGRKRMMVAVVSAGLIASTTALTTCANAVWSSPPRFDGAGYAVLARSWLSGQGYRAIDHPERPPHAHFPPGYPLVLALTWGLAGESVPAAHAVSVLCTIGASLATWWWFRRLLAGPEALVLGMALAVNWAWARAGSGIQSEPLYLLLGQLAILVATRVGQSQSHLTRTRWGTKASGPIVLGLLLAACVLTRHAAIGLTAAIVLDLAIRGRWRAVLITTTVAAAMVSPWVVWMVTVGPETRTQAALMAQGAGTGIGRFASQLVFYAQRIPDQLTGPFVEVGTVFQRSPIVAILASGWALAATAVIVGGWIPTLRRPRRRLVGLIAFSTLGLLLVWPYTEAGRFLIPLIPCILLGALEGLTTLWRRGDLPRWLGTHLPSTRERLLAASLIFATSLPYPSYMLVTGRTRAIDAAHRDFDAACAWLSTHAGRPGPVLSRHPGEVFWQTGRTALEVPTAERSGDVDADAATIARTIATYRVAYLLIDHERYAGATPSPLARFVVEHPERVRKVWSRETDRTTVSLYEVEPIGPATP